MRKILIASHGKMAGGIKSTIKMLVGDVSNIYSIDAYLDDQDITGKFSEFLAVSGKEDEIVIFTDIRGGSVNQRIINMIPKDREAFVITGFNLPIVLEILYAGENLTEEIIDGKIAVCRMELERMPELWKESDQLVNENAEVEKFLVTE